MHRGLLFLFCVGSGACGRVGFDSVVDASPIDASVVDAPFATPIAIAELSSSANEDDPSMTGDMLELYFMSYRTGAQLLYRSTRGSVTEAWSPPTMVTELNTDGINNAKVSNDGLTLMFSSSRTPTAGMQDLWIATRADRTSPWVPRRIDELATAQNDIEPWLIDSNALVLYFTTNRTSSTTLWTTTRASPADPFVNARRIDELASTGYDGSPWVDAAEQLVVFHSARGVNYDLYYATRPVPTGSWTAPLPVVGLDTAANESDAWLSPDGRTLLFTSDQSGNEEIYITTR